MTKKEIIAELKKYDIHATLRPRKAILVNLLDRVREEHKKDQLTSDVAFMDDIYYATKVDPIPWIDKFAAWVVLAMVWTFIVFIGIEFISFFLDTDFFGAAGIVAIFLLLFGIPLRVFLWEKKWNG